MNTNSVNQSPFPAPARFRLNLLKALWFIPGLFNFRGVRTELRVVEEFHRTGDPTALLNALLNKELCFNRPSGLNARSAGLTLFIEDDRYFYAYVLGYNVMDLVKNRTTGDRIKCGMIRLAFGEHRAVSDQYLVDKEKRYTKVEPAPADYEGEVIEVSGLEPGPKAVYRIR